MFLGLYPLIITTSLLKHSNGTPCFIHVLHKFVSGSYIFSKNELAIRNMHNYNHDMLQQEKQSHLSSQLYTTNTQKEAK